jgi:hypothetical protein
MRTEFQLTYQIDTTPWSAILILCLIPEPGPAVSTDRPSQCSLAQPHVQILAFKSAGGRVCRPRSSCSGPAPSRGGNGALSASITVPCRSCEYCAKLSFLPFQLSPQWAKQDNRWLAYGGPSVSLNAYSRYKRVRVIYPECTISTLSQLYSAFYVEIILYITLILPLIYT